MLGDTLATEKSISEIKSVIKQNNMPKSIEEYAFGHMYFWAKDTILAEKHWRQAYHLDPENFDVITNLTWILIRSGINVEEGLELSQENLKKYPDNNFLLWMKGLGLYKSGKYEEALRILKETDDKYMGYLKDLKDDIKEVEQALANHK
jgi:tetratricopeptide (TPR) repeat protein